MWNSFRTLVMPALIRNSQLTRSRFLATKINSKPKQFQSENELRKVISAKNSNSDTFGSLSINITEADHVLKDKGDIEEEKFIKNPKDRNQHLRRKQYADMIKDHLKHKRFKEAINVLEVRMLKEDGCWPNSYIYNLIIAGCARVGYSQKCFELFLRMRQRGLLANGATYTSLFNACANSPYKKDSLERAHHLRGVMLEKGHEGNLANYHAMIKAFGRCGDLKTAFLLVDEMLEKKLTITCETYNFLLQACASDKEFGFRHALLVWHKMYQQRIKPDLYSFNLMLRCCRDTELGDAKASREIIDTILLRNPEGIQQIGNYENVKVPLLEGDKEESSLVEIVEKKQVEMATTPNLLALKPYLGNLIKINQIKKAEDRLLLLGGFSGFLELMESFGVDPDLKTYTLLIEVIPSTRVAENKLLRTIRKMGIKCDVDFFNMLMKKRSLRFAYEEAREVLDVMIKKAHLEPDIITYGILALSCKSRYEAFQLINEMNSNNIKINMPIIGAMIKQGCCHKNFRYIVDMLKIIKDFKIKPSEQLMETLDEFIKECNALKKKDSKNAPEHFRENVKQFKEDLAKWKEEMGLGNVHTMEDVKIALKEKPWDQFQEVQQQGAEDIKIQNIQHKRKLRHHIKMIKAREQFKPKDDVKLVEQENALSQ